MKRNFLTLKDNLALTEFIKAFKEEIEQKGVTPDIAKKASEHLEREVTTANVRNVCDALGIERRTRETAASYKSAFLARLEYVERCLIRFCESANGKTPGSMEIATMIANLKRNNTQQ